jgi:serine/threonine protein kinase
MSVPWSAPEMLMDETSGSIASEVWSFAATIYSLLAGRSPFEVPGESNKSVDLISRINRAKVQPIGRSDVPVSLERLLQKAMSRKPESRPSSVLELVRGFQAVETELHVPQTSIEVAMDDWALATVSDLEERTRIRPVAGAAIAAKPRRRRRSAGASDYAAIGTLLREPSSLRPSTASSPVVRGMNMRVLAWWLVAGFIAVIVLGAVATATLFGADSDEIPKVTDIAATLTSDSVQFSWNDPGIRSGDQYQIATRAGASSIQRLPEFTVDARDGDRVCITVTVNRGGAVGPASGEKCVDFVSG